MRRFWIAVIVVLFVLDAAAVAELWRAMEAKSRQADEVAAPGGKPHAPSRGGLLRPPSP